MSETKATFVWHDLMSTQVEKAGAFYTGLLGWKTGTMEIESMGNYQMIQVGEEPIGGFMPLDPSHGVPSHWIGYIAVASVDVCCARAVELGGKICVPSMDIPGVGRFAVLEDPQGGVFSPYQCAEPCGEEKPKPADFAGRFVWNELLTSDPDAAAAFYTGLFGWSHKKEPMGELDYHLFLVGEEMVGGMMKFPQPMPRPYWMPYICVKDVDASARKAVSMGATSCHPPTDIPNIGRFSVLQDPTGAAFALFRGMEMK